MNAYDYTESEDELNRTMITKYIDKHYKIYKVFVMDRKKPINLKNPLKYNMFDYAQEIEVNSYLVFKLIAKIFSVSDKFVHNIANSLAIAEFDRLQRLQLNALNEGNSF